MLHEQIHIRNEIAKRFMYLEASDQREMTAAFEKCKNALQLKDHIDPFEIFADLDDNVPMVRVADQK